MEAFVDIAGYDDAPGSSSAPFRTIQRALDWVAARRASGSDAEGGLTVNILPGRHRLKASLMFGPEHAGSRQSPTVLRGHDGAVISGASEGKPTVPADAICRRNALLSAFQIPEAGPLLEIGEFGFNRPIAPAPPFVLGETGLLRGARWPERGWFTAAQISAPKGGGTHVLTLDEKSFEQIKGEPAPWIEFILTAEWDWHMARVRSLDTARRQLVFASPHQAAPAAGSPVRFAIHNMRAGLSRPGTSWLDPANAQIVVHPAAAREIELCSMPGHLVRLHNTGHLVFETLTFRGGLANAIHGAGCEDVSIVCCSAVGFAAGGFHVEGKRIRILDSLVKEVGTTALRIEAGHQDSLAAGDSLVQGCTFARWGWRKPIYEPAVKLFGVGTTVRDCAFSDAPHLAIQMSGNDHLVEGCTFTRLVTEIDDMGAIYVNSGENLLERGHIIRRNLFRDVGTERKIASAIYLDRASSGISISDNVFLRIAGDCGSSVRAIHINGGRDIDIHGNLFVDCDCSIELIFYLNTWGFIDVTAMEAGLSRTLARLGTSPHRLRYPELASLPTQSLFLPTSNTMSGNITVLGSQRAQGIVVSGGPANLVEQNGNQVVRPSDERFALDGRWTELFAASNRAELRAAIEKLADTWSASIFGTRD